MEPRHLMTSSRHLVLGHIYLKSMEYDSLVYGVLIDTCVFDAFQDFSKIWYFIEHFLTGQMIGIRGVVL